MQSVFKMRCLQRVCSAERCSDDPSKRISESQYSHIHIKYEYLKVNASANARV